MNTASTPEQSTPEQSTPEHITKEQLDRAAQLPTANIGDAMDRLNVVHPHIRAVWPGARLAAPAFTVQTAGGDNKAIHDCLDEVPAGSVMVINSQEMIQRALMGELIAGRAMVRGVVGMVIDGAVRDAQQLAEIGFPVFARAVTPAGPYRNGPGRWQVPIAIGSVAVMPGDLIVADDDGVVVIPQAEVPEVLTRAEAKHQSEAQDWQNIQQQLVASRD